MTGKSRKRVIKKPKQQNLLHFKRAAMGFAPLAMASALVLTDFNIAEAGVDVFDRQGNKISSNDGSLAQRNIGIIQYARGDRPARYANFDTFNITYSIDEVSHDEHYVDVTMVFNERHDRFARHFVVFNIPKSLYEPEQIVREVYNKGNPEVYERLIFKTWTSDPGEGATKWVANSRYVRINPDNVANNVSNGTVGLKITGPGTTTDRVSIEDGRWGHDWSRIDWRYQTDTIPDTKHTFEESIKKTSRSIYVDDRSSANAKVIYKFRARVKDYNEPMNFLLGYNQAAGGWNAYEAVFAETPDNRPYKDRFPLTMPERTIVDSLATLDEAAKASIKEKLQAANADLFNNNNSTGHPVIASIDNISVPDAADGNQKVTVTFTDGSFAELPASALVVERAQAGQNTPTTTPPEVTQPGAPLTYNAEDHTAETPMGNRNSRGSIAPFGLYTEAEKQSMTRLQLPQKLPVTDVGSMQYANMAGLDPARTSQTAENLWNEKLVQIKTINNIGGGGTLATGTAINGKGTRFSNDSVTEDQPMAYQTSAALKRDSAGNILGILVKGPRYGDGAMTEAGIITADMLFTRAEAVDPLPQIKADAKNQIDRLPLSDEAKTALKNQVDNAQDQAGVERVLADANRQVADLQRAKDAAKQTIGTLTNLTPTEKGQKNDAIDTKLTVADVNAVVAEAKQEDLNRAKARGNATVETLDLLTPAEREEFTNRITLADTPSAVNDIVNEAIEANEAKRAAQQANDQKERAKQVIDAIVGLTPQERQEFKDRIDRATDPNEITLIIEEAKGTAIAQRAKDQIDALPHLNNAQKQALKDAIDEDRTEYNVNARVAEGQALNTSMGYLKELVEEADRVKESDRYTNSDSPRKEAFDNALTAAKEVSVPTGVDATRPTVEDLISTLQDSINALGATPPVRTVNKDALRDEYNLGDSIKASERYQTSTQPQKDAYDAALEAANTILGNNDATQTQVDEALNDLIEAKAALDGTDPANPAPVFTVQPKDIVLLKGVTIAQPISIATVTDNTQVGNISIVDAQNQASELGLTKVVSGDTATEKTVSLSGQTQENTGAYVRKLQASDDVGAVGLSSTFTVRVVDITVNEPQTAISKGYGEALTADDVKAKLQLDLGDNPENSVDYDVILPETGVPTSGKDQPLTVTVRTKAPASMSEEERRNFISQEKTLDVKVSFNTLAEEITPDVPQAPVLIDNTTVITEAEKNAIIEALKNANKIDENTSRFPSGTRYTVNTNGEVIITYPDNSMDIVRVPFKQRDDLKYNPTAPANPVNIESPIVEGGTLTDTEKENIKNAVEIPTDSGGEASIGDDIRITISNDTPTVDVTVTYDDGTSEVVKVPVRQEDKAKYTPVVSDGKATVSIPLTDGTQIPQDEKAGITDKVSVPAVGNENPPAITKEVVSDVKDGSGTNLGEKVVDVQITYPDNTTETVEVPLRRIDNETYTPVVSTGDAAITTATTNGTPIAEADKATITDKVSVPAIGNENPPEVVKQVVSDIKDGTGANDGKKVVDVQITYPDNSTELVEVPVRQMDSEKYTPVVSAGEASIDGDTVIGTPIADADKATITDKVSVPAIDNENPPEVRKEVVSPIKNGTDENDGKAVVDVQITYPDNTTETVEVPIRQIDKEKYTPTVDGVAPVSVELVNDTPIPQEDQAAITDKVSVAGIGTEAAPAIQKSVASTIKDGSGENIGKKVVDVLVTYPDDSFETVEVALKVADATVYIPQLVNDLPVITSVDNVGDTLTNEDQTAVINNVEVTSGNGTTTPTVEKRIENPVVREENGIKGVDVVVIYEDGSRDTIFVPISRDSDGDGFSDAEENASGSNANDANQTPVGNWTSDRLNPVINPILVANADRLTQEEKDAIKAAITSQNDLPENTIITVADNGRVVITYPDGSRDILQPSETIYVNDSDSDGFTDTEETQAGSNPNNPAQTPQGSSTANRLDPQLDPIEVGDVNSLTPEEKEAIKTAIQNNNTLPDGTVISVSDTGEVTITYPDNSQDTIPATETVFSRDTDNDGFSDREEEASGTGVNDPTSHPTDDTTANRLNPSIEPVTVNDREQLTEAEKDAVKDAVNTQNNLPNGTQVSVGSNGEVTITYPDNSQDIIPATETVVTRDSDNDGFTDREETDAQSNPNNPAETPSGSTTADRLTPSIVPVPVRDTANLTDVEKDAVEDAIRNQNTLPNGTQITVENNGRVVIVYPDGSSDILTPVETTVKTDANVPGASDVSVNANGDVVIVPPGVDVTEVIITYTPEGSNDPIRVSVPKENGTWQIPEGSGLTLNENGQIVIPHDRVKDGSVVTVVSKNGNVVSPEVGTTVVPVPSTPSTETPNTPSTPNAPDAPDAPQISTNESGDVVITPPTDATGVVITYTPEGSDTPTVVEVTKENDTWVVPDGSGVSVDEQGNIVIPETGIKDGTPVSVISKKDDTVSDNAASVIDPIKDNVTVEGERPERPEIIQENGNVIITPPTENVTELEITYTPENSDRPITVVVGKDGNGWNVPPEFTINENGDIVIPDSVVKDGTTVTVVAKNGDATSSDPNATTVPSGTVTDGTTVGNPTVSIGTNDDVVITPPSDATSIEVTYTPEGSNTPVVVTIPKGEDGTWNVPDGFSTDADGNIIIPDNKVKDDTPVTVVAKNGDATSEIPATVQTPASPNHNPDAPQTPEVVVNDNRDIVITPKDDNTAIEVTYTPEGSDTPVTVVIPKREDGTWELPNGFIEENGKIILPEDKVKDGTVVSVIGKNGDVTSDTAASVVEPTVSTTPTTPTDTTGTTQAPEAPSITVDNGNVIITPTDGTDSIEIILTPKGEENPISVVIKKDDTGKWVAPDNSIPVVNPDGTISVSISEIENDTPVSVIGKNGETPSDTASTILVPGQKDSDKVNPTIDSPIDVANPNELTEEEKQALEDKVRTENTLPDRTQVEVLPDGTINITYPDQSTDVIPPTKTVMESRNGEGATHSIPAYDLQADADKDGFSNLEELQKGSNPDNAASVPANEKTSDKISITTDVIPVRDTANLTDADKQAIKDSIQNKNDLPASTTIEVSTNGTVTITYPDGSVTLLPTDTVVRRISEGSTGGSSSGNRYIPRTGGTTVSTPGLTTTAPVLIDDDKDGFSNSEEALKGSNPNDPKSVPAGEKISDRIDLKTELVLVLNPKQLTSTEKEAIRNMLLKHNTLPAGTDIRVSDDGNVSIIYPDGSSDTLQVNHVLYVGETGVGNQSALGSLPKTGDPAGASGAMGGMLLGTSALFAFIGFHRKKKEDEE